MRFAAWFVTIWFAVDARADDVPADAGSTEDVDAATAVAPEPPLEPVPVPVVPAPPEPVASVEQPAPPDVQPHCGLWWYLEPSVSLSLGSYTSHPGALAQSSNVGAFWTRFSGGGLFRVCERGRETTHVRFGGVLVLEKLDLKTHNAGGEHVPNTPGLGAEVSMDWPIAPRLRIGPRLGLTVTAHDLILEVGARLRYRGTAYVGVDIYRSKSSEAAPSCDELAVAGCKNPTTGAMLGVGLEGRVGNVVVIAGLGVGSVALLVLAQALGGTY